VTESTGSATEAAGIETELTELTELKRGTMGHGAAVPKPVRILTILLILSRIPSLPAVIQNDVHRALSIVPFLPAGKISASVCRHAASLNWIQFKPGFFCEPPFCAGLLFIRDVLPGNKVSTSQTGSVPA